MPWFFLAGASMVLSEEKWNYLMEGRYRRRND